jgi:hypothetical protein
MATGTSLSSTSNLATGQRIVVASAKFAFEPAAPDPDLVSNERIGQGEKQWDILTYARLSDASALTEGVDLSQTQQLITTPLSITPTEHGIITTLSKRLIRRQGDTNVMTAAGAMIGASLRRRMAKDVISLYTGFSKSIVGASNAMDITHFRGAYAYLVRDDKTTSATTSAAFGPAEPPFNAALHIEQISDIILDVSDVGSDNRPAGFSEDLLQRWWVTRDRLYSVQIWHSGNIVANASDDATGTIMSKDALHLVMANEAESTEQPDHSLRAIEFGIFQEWGEGERADEHGVAVVSDVAASV